MQFGFEVLAHLPLVVRADCAPVVEEGYLFHKDTDG